ncbi:hypothetical protein PR202_ga06572 [Eleusine coracana subsp. coracana]|uniref:OTU domain-containing protein n=1 Tax=Eleusine coracana subsp. coracana TaxID=191504 RepID=A0AAV5BX87_ELECO|nr:hypothetical protein PR202_ga06572 [Eleusine coracana subsp. coracana]
MSEQQDHVSKSSCSSISTSTQGSEEEVTIGTLITEPPNSAKSLGRRLSHLDSIPHTPRINGKIPDVNNATIDHESLLERLGTYGLAEYQIEGDGNCQFRALADQIFRNPDYHKHVRKAIVKQVHPSFIPSLSLPRGNGLKEFKKHYEGYVPMEYKDYLKKMKRFWSILDSSVHLLSYETFCLLFIS